MYTREDLLKTYDEIKEKIQTTEITDEVFVELENELNELARKKDIVTGQIADLVEKANDMCVLHRQIHGCANELYYNLKRKQLTDQGIDLSKPCNAYKYDLHCLKQITYGGFFKVELKDTMSR